MLKEILQGRKGNSKAYADVGSASKMQGLGTHDIRKKSVFSDAEMDKLGIDHETRRKLRPDALVIEDQPAAMVIEDQSAREKAQKEKGNITPVATYSTHN